MKNQKSFTIVILLLVLLLLAVTKPNKTSFNDYLSSGFGLNSDDTILSGIFKKGIEVQANLNIKYSDFIIFSVASTKIGDKRVQFLGALGQWFQI